MDNIILQKTWVQGSPVIVDNLLGTAFTGEAQAHTFVVSGVDAAQEPVTITGTITGKFLAANNVTVPLTGSLVNGAASVTLTDECYDVPGRYILSIYATNGETTQCLYCAVGNVFRTDSQTIAYPSTDLPNITTLMTQLEEILDGWPADYTALQTKVSALMREDYWDSGKLAEMKYAGYVDGYYKDYSTGTIVENADYSYSGNIHILPYSDFKIVNAYGDVHVTYWDTNGDFISGELLGSTHGNLLTVPTNCDSVVLSYATSERNQIALAYINNILVVGVGRQFPTISAAVSVANDGDTILVYPGVYSETVDANAKKVHIRGVSKAQCILTYSANNYLYPPLSIAKGSVSNLTIYASWSGDTTYDRAYCVHIDSDYERGETLAFDNVNFVTDRGDCVGIGTRTDFHLTFTNCLFHSKASAVTGCIYNHDSESESTGINGYSVYENQSVEYINCTMINETEEYTIVLQSQERLEGCCSITFTGNQIIQPANDGKTIAMVLYQDRHLTNNHYLGSSDFILTGISGLNTDPILGYVNLLDEVNSKIGNTPMGTTATTITGAIAEHEGDIGGINSTIGNTPMGTTATTITGAIAEHEGDLGDLKSASESYVSAYSEFGVLDVNQSSGFEVANLFDINADNSTTGYYDRTNTFVESATVGMTDYIAVIPGQKYYTALSGAGFELWYDSNKNFLTYTDKATGITSYVTAPANAAYGKFMFLTANISTFEVYSPTIKKISAQSAIDTTKKINESFVFSPNLLNKNDPDYLVDKYYKYDTGALVDPAVGYDQSGFIPVTAGNKYTSNIKNFSVVWYKSDKTFLSGTNWGTFNTDGYVTAPANAYYARFGAQRANENFPKWQVVAGDTLPDYMPFGSLIVEGLILQSAWDGMSGVAFGTSLTYRAQTTGGYLQYLPNMLGATVDNQGIGNATILVTSDFPALDILAAVKSYSNYSNKNFCILEGFVNDFYRNPDKLGTWKDSDETTVCGCVRSAINYILTANPDITLILVLDHYGCVYDGSSTASTYTNTSGLTQYEYYEEIAKVADSLGVPVIKEYELSGMNEYTTDYFIDNIHPSALGAEQSANTIYSVMKNITPKVTD